MFKQGFFENSFENRGTVLEQEYFHSVNKHTYGNLMDAYEHPEHQELRTAADIERALMRKYADKPEYTDSFKQDSYINFKDAMKLVEKCQPGNPEKPQAFFARALNEEISALFGKSYQSKFFTAVGSHLDTKHGIDAFIKLYDDQGKELAYVTLDISTWNKGQSKADHLIVIDRDNRDHYDSSSSVFDKKEFNDRIKAEANTLVALLQEKIKKQTKKIGDEKKVTGGNNHHAGPDRQRPRLNKPEAIAKTTGMA